ncbi:MAG: hypothetical protein ACK595_08545 [Planctomycetota bacterium]
MATRRSVWSDEDVQRAARAFVPVADEVSRLQRDKEPDCVFFQGFCELGHYGGKTRPSNTRQGIYAVTPSGRFLASCNPRDAAEVLAMLAKAKKAWDAMPPAQRRAADAALDPAAVRRFEQLRPTDGLVLRVYSRDLPRQKVTPGWRGQAWNQDHAWFRRDEALAMVPAPEVGAERPFPADALLRLARVHLVDNVRGQTMAHGPQHVVARRLVARTVALAGDAQSILFEGAVRIERVGTWASRGYGPDRPQRLGFDAQLLGAAKFDRTAQRFTEWRMLAVGMRHGATEFNGRQDDFGPAPMGVAFDLQADDAPAVAPSMHWAYGWQ